MFRRTRAALALLFATLLLAASATATPAYAAPKKQDKDINKLTKAVTVKGVLKHLRALQKVSDQYGDRAAGRPGYGASVRYVRDQLRKAGYSPTVQQFQFQYAEEKSELERTSPSPREFEEGADFLRNTFDSGSPKGSANGALYVVEPGGTTSGCEESDFDSMPSGSIALMQRGGCEFRFKALNAQNNGAAGAIIWNNTTGMINMIGDATGLTIPTVFASQEAGTDLASTPGANVRVVVDYDTEQRTTYNVTAQTKKGNNKNVVMAGAHLDGIQDGAGMNDNGSGAAALLETAIKMKNEKPKNAVRFAWWGAEEEGLLGAEYYVEQLSEKQQKDIALYLNFDMVASANYMFGVYDGDDSGGTADDGSIPEGSAQIEDVFEKFYSRAGEPSQDSAFDGRSDYGPFIAVGIPAGGLFTGAEVPKTPSEAAIYGGVAGEAYDPCYHQACDNLTGEGQDDDLYDLLRDDYKLVGNINKYALDVNSDAIATSVLTFAKDTSTVNGDSGGSGKATLKSQKVMKQAQGKATR